MCIELVYQLYQLLVHNKLVNQCVNYVTQTRVSSRRSTKQFNIPVLNTRLHCNKISVKSILENKVLSLYLVFSSFFPHSLVLFSVCLKNKLTLQKGSSNHGANKWNGIVAEIGKGNIFADASTRFHRDKQVTRGAAETRRAGPRLRNGTRHRVFMNVVVV